MAVSSQLNIIIGLQDKTKKAMSGPGGLLNNFKKLGKVALGVAAGGIAALGAGFVGFAAKAIPAASDLNEAMNATSVVFGDAASIVQKFGQTAAETAGLSAAEFNQMAAQTGAMLQNYGLSADEAAKQTVDLGQRAADMASIFNTDVSDAMTAINAALRGEADPIERFGVSMNMATVQAKALEMGFKKVGNTFKANELTQARMALLFEQTNAIAGDFVNTSDQLANAQRVAGAQWQNFLATIGKIGLPIMNTFWKTISGSVLPTLTSFANFIRFVVEEGGTLNDWAGKLPGWLEPIAETVGRLINVFQYLLDVIIGGKLPEALKEFGPLEFVAQAFGDLLPAGIMEAAIALDNFINKAQEVLTPIIDWVKNNVELKDALIALATAIGVVLIGALAPLAGTILGIIAAFSVLTGAIALLRSAWENNFLGIRDRTETAISFIRGLFENLPGIIEDVRGTIERVSKNLFGGIRGPAEEAIGTATDLFGELRDKGSEAFGGLQEPIETVQGIVEGFFQNIRTWWDNNGAVVIAALLMGWEIVKGAITSAISVIVPAIQELFSNIRGRFSEFTPLMDKFRELWVAIQPIVAVVLAAIGALVLAAVGLISGAFQGLAKAIGPLIDTFIDVVGGIVTFLTGVANYVVGFVKLIIALFQGNSEGVKEALDQMREGVSQIWQGLVDTVVGLVTGLVSTVLAFIEGLWHGIVDFFTNLYNDLVGGSIIPDLVNDIIDWFDNLIDDALQLWQDLKDGIIEFVDMIVEKIEVNLSKALDFFRDKFNEIMGGIEDAIQPVKDLWDDLVSAIKGFWDWLSGKVFNFKINLPELPPWAIPHSPLPIHTAWKAFAQDMERLLPQVNRSLAGAAITPAGGGLALAGAAGGAPEIHNHFYLNANYTNGQSESSLARDVMMLERLYGRGG